MPVTRLPSRIQPNYSIDELDKSARERALEKIAIVNLNDYAEYQLKEDLEQECGVVFLLPKDQDRDFRLWYSLNHCQGDGVSIEADATLRDLADAQIRIAKSLEHNRFLNDDGSVTTYELSPKRREELERVFDSSIISLAEEVDAEWGFNPENHNYPHLFSGNVTIRTKVNHRGFDDTTVAFDWDTDDADDAWHDRMAELEKRVEEAVLDHIKCVKRHLQRYGYHIIDAVSGEDCALGYCRDNGVRFNEDGTDFCMKGDDADA